MTKQGGKRAGTGRKKAENPRIVQIAFRVTDEELTAIKERAKINKTDMSGYIRHILFNRVSILKTHTNKKEVKLS